MGSWGSFIPWEGFWGNVIAGLITELIVVVVGVLFAYGIRAGWEKWRYGGWQVRVIRGDELILERPISPPKAKEILREPSELSVFLKGVVSPYEFIGCDLIGEGRDMGLLVEDRKNKRFIIDLDKNPVGGRKGTRI